MNDNHQTFQDKFVTLAIEHGVNIIDGDSTKANKIHTKLTNLMKTIGKQDKKKILPILCENNNESVRIWAATYLLDINKKIALSTLQKTIADETILGLTAEIIVDMWKNKTLNL